MSIASLSARPSPPYDRVGVRIVTFEACSGFTRVTARWIARPPKAAFVTRLRSVQLLVQTARQLPGQSTIPWVEPTSTGETRLRGALNPDHRLHFDDARGELDEPQAQGVELRDTPHRTLGHRD